MARIRKRGRKWYVLFRDPLDPSKELTDSKHLVKSDAVQRQKELELELMRDADGVALVYRSMRYAEWAEVWFDLLDVKPKTLAGYRSLLDRRVLPAFGRKQLRGIRPLDIETWLKGLEREGVSASQRRQALNVLSGSLRKAVANGILQSNPASHVKRPTVGTAKPEPLTPDELQAIADAVPAPYQAMILFMGYVGARLGETIALQRNVVDVAADTVTLDKSMSDVNGYLELVAPKSGRSRTVTMPAFLSDLLAIHLDTFTAPDGDAFVFTDSKGKPLRANNWRARVFVPAVEAAGIGRPVRVHDLRHTAASMLVSAGVNPKVVQAQLGHASISTTLDIYGHLYPSDRDEAAEALDRVYRNNLSTS